MIGQRLKALRCSKGMTQAQLAKAIGMEGRESTLRMWELDKSHPSIQMLLILADYFDITVDCLLGREPFDG